MFLVCPRPQSMIASNYEWVRGSSNSYLLYSETVAEISRQIIMAHISNDPYLYLYRKKMTYQNNIEATLTNTYNGQISSSITDNVFLETTEQIQATLGIEGLGKLQEIVQSRKKTLSESELDELARNFANWDF